MDYRYQPDDVAEVLRGHRERVGHLDRPALFVRMLQTMPWQRIVTALTLDEVRALLTPETHCAALATILAGALCTNPGLLRADPVPPAEWSADHARRLRSSVLSDRWYRTT